MIENFILLGYFGNTHFIQHCDTRNEIFTHLISCEIYNELFKNKILTSPTDNVVIYSINSYKKEYKIISIQNAMEPGYVFDVAILSSFYPDLLRNKSLNLKNIRYEYKNNSYHYQEIELYYLPEIPSDYYIQFNEIIYFYQNFY